MSSDRDRDEGATEDLKQGLGLLWRAARKTAGEIRRDLDKTNVGRAIDDAGRELVRAASNVVGRLGAEIRKPQPPEPAHADHAEQQPAEGERKQPDGPTDEDPGFRIAVDGPADKGEPR